MQLKRLYPLFMALIATRDWIVAQLVFVLLKFLRLFPMQTSARYMANFARFIGPLTPRHQLGLRNLRLAFPEKPEAEIRQIAKECWAHSFRTVFEYAHLDQIFDLETEGVSTGKIDVLKPEMFLKLRDDGLPAIIFTAHLANFELLPLCAAKFDLDLLSLFRAPNNPRIAKRMAEARNVVVENLLPSQKGAALHLMAALGRGTHVGLLVDQKFSRGIYVPFFGHPAKSNPLLAKLARAYDCPVHGAWVVRLPDGRFQLEMTDELDLPRDAKGDVDIVGTTALVNDVIEGWVRKNPAQWLWFHRRWD